MFKKTALAFALSISALASTAHAGVISLKGDTKQGFGGQLIAGQYIGSGGMVRLNTKNGPDAGAKIDGPVTLDFDFRYQRNHVGLATVAGSNNGRFMLSNGAQNIQFGSHDLDKNGKLTTNAFNGSLASGDWILKLTNPSGGDPWAAFRVAASFNVAGACRVDCGGGNASNGGGNVPVPATGLFVLVGLIGIGATAKRNKKKV